MIDCVHFYMGENLGSASSPIRNVSAKEQMQPYKCTTVPVKKNAELIKLRVLNKLPDTSTVVVPSIDNRLVVRSAAQPKEKWGKWDKLTFFACAGAGALVLAGIVLLGFLGTMGIGGAVMIGIGTILVLPAIVCFQRSNDILPVLRPFPYSNGYQKNQLPTTIFGNSERSAKSSEIATVNAESDSQFSVTAF